MPFVLLWRRSRTGKGFQAPSRLLLQRGELLQLSFFAKLYLLRRMELETNGQPKGVIPLHRKFLPQPNGRGMGQEIES
jgi:hypothetical protein